MRFIKFQAQVERCGTHYARANSRNSAQGLVFRYRSCPFTNFGTLCVQTSSFWYSLRSCQFKKLGTMFVPFYMQA